MAKRTDIKSILIIGAGPIVIGQACEFDYSGAQACKALREEGYRVILINSNPATIMTDPEFADRTYIEPITPEIVEKIIIREKPDALLPTLGGQTALNTAMALSGPSMPISAMASRNFSRSSARSITSALAPISSTPYFSSTPDLASETAVLSAVWPPSVGSSASGRSLAMIFSTISGVIGSI